MNTPPVLDRSQGRRPWSGRTELQIGPDREPGEGPPIVVTNPATEEIFAELRSASPAQVTRAVAAAKAAMDDGLLNDPEARSAALHRLAEIMEKRADDILNAIIPECGTPITTARPLHANTPANVVRWLAEAALVDRTERLGRDEGPPASEVVVFQRPVGVVAGITAYNYPMLFAVLKAGGAFAAGCSTVLLPSPQAPVSTLLFADLVEEAGFPEGAISVILGGPDIGGALIDDPRVKKVSFTGSVATGKVIMRAAAENLQGLVLELGGKSAAVVLPDADLSSCVAPIHQRYLRNAGQGCSSPTRVLVPESRYEEFLEASRVVFDATVVGDPWDPDVLTGPVISAAHRERVEGFIQGAIDEGGSVVAGQFSRPDLERGFFVNPVLLGGLENRATANQNEIFGPVGTVQTYRDINDAIAIANDSVYGLHTALWGPTDQCLDLAGRFNVGTVVINGGGPVRASAPSGGTNQSGIGREMGEAGIREFLEPQQVQWIA